MAKEKAVKEKVVKEKTSSAKKISSPPAETKQQAGKDKIVELISKMSVLELSELVKTLEEKFDVKASAGQVVQAAQAPSTEQAAKPEEEKTEFTVSIKSFGENKIRVIKSVREVTTLGLKEAKDLVDSAPNIIKEGISKEEAENIKKVVESAGGVCEIK